MFDFIEKIRCWNRERVNHRKWKTREKKLLLEARRHNLEEVLAISKQHEKVFRKYKNIFGGKESVVLLASGSTLNKYKPIAGAHHIAVNGVVNNSALRDAIEYYFIQDRGTEAYLNNILSLECKEIFFGRPVNPISVEGLVIPENWFANKKNNANLYYTTYPNNEFRYDITTFGLPDFGSVIFSAFSFSLWMRPARIYLVGCDCSDRYFDGRERKHSLSRLIRPWIEASKFQKIYYPDIDIISINPVGLKGVFKDKYM